MPFKSEAQAKFMFANHPQVAKEFAAHTDFSKLPQHVGDSHTPPQLQGQGTEPDRKIEAMKQILQASKQQQQPAGQINYGASQ